MIPSAAAPHSVASICNTVGVVTRLRCSQRPSDLGAAAFSGSMPVVPIGLIRIFHHIGRVIGSCRRGGAKVLPFQTGGEKCPLTKAKFTLEEGEQQAHRWLMACDHLHRAECAAAD